MSQNDQMYDDLEKRTQESYETRKGERTFTGIFQTQLTLPIWSAAEGEHQGNFIPYPAGANDPRVRLKRMEEGQFTYVFNHYVHGNVGRRDKMYLCLETYHEECPICNERNKLMKQGPPEVERLVATYEKRLAALRARRRVIYNWECLDSDEEADKGVQIWEASHYMVEERMLEQAKLPKSQGGAMINFSHPSQGKTLFFRRIGKGLKDTDYKGYRWMDRQEPIPQDLLDDVFVLDGLIYIPTYDEVREALWDEDEVAEDNAGEVQDERIGGGEGSTPAPRRRSRAASVGALDDQEETPPYDDEPEKTTNAELTVDDGGDISDAKQAPPPRRRSRASVTEDEAPSEESGSVEEQPTPRRRARTQTKEESQPAARKKPKPVAASVEPEELECPLPGVVFGEEGDAYEDCEGCVHWNPCVKATVALNSQKEG